MKKMRKAAVFLSLVLVFSMVVPSVANIAGMGEQVQAATLKLNTTSKTLNIGTNLKLKVSGLKKGYKVSWSSNKKAVASVTSAGIVKAKGAGEAKITATVKKKSKVIKKLTCKVNVNYPELKRSLSLTNQTVGINNYFELWVVNAKANESITYVSNNPTIATVTQSGVVRGVGIGTTTIYALVRSADDKQVASLQCKVDVISTIQSRELNYYSKSVNECEAFELKVIDASSVDYITFKSSDESVASVKSVGAACAKITGEKQGSAIITVTIVKSGNEVEEKTCRVVVNAYQKERSLNIPNDMLIIAKGQKFAVTVTGLTPKDTVKFETEDTKTAKMDGNVLSAKKEGYTRLIVTITFPTGETEQLLATVLVQ